MRVLVTGGAGFIGSHLCERLLSEAHEVCCVDNLDRFYSLETKKANIKSMGDKLIFLELDILDRKGLEGAFSDFKPDVIVHEAAQAGVRVSVEDPLKTIKVNIEGLTNLLESARKNDPKRIVFASSSSIYGKVEYLPFDEKHPKEPISPYGVSKLAGEELLRVYEQLYGIKHVCLRYFTVYGPRIRPDLAIYKFTKDAIEGSEITVYGDGAKTRDFTYVSDAVDATVKAISKGEGAYNVGGGTRLTVKQLAEKIIELVGQGRIKYVKDQPGDVEHTHSDTSKAERELGWKPKVSFEEGLEKTVEWIKKQEN